MTLCCFLLRKTQENRRMDWTYPAENYTEKFKGLLQNEIFCSVAAPFLNPDDILKFYLIIYGFSLYFCFFVRNNIKFIEKTGH